MPVSELTKIAIFEGTRVRKILFNNEWYFSVIDVCGVLAESVDAGAYWRKLKQRLVDENSEVVTKCHGLKLTALDGKKRLTDCANTEGIFRIIQSIPSPKAEPFKNWLARIGKERIDEIENPELGIERVKSIYAKKGYDKNWVDKRLRGIAVRQTLTDEWAERGVTKPTDYAILTNEIMQGAFDLKVSEYKQEKGLERENLRDHMTDLELIITMLGEATTAQISQQRDSQGVHKLRKDAKDGGAVAGRTRKDIEQQTGNSVITGQNFLSTKKKVRAINKAE